MPRSGSRQDIEHFDDWESFTLDDDIYAGTETDALDDWEDDGAIAEVREAAPVVISRMDSLETDASAPVELDDESAEVFSLLERSQAKRSTELLELSGPSEDELSKIEEVGIDEYIDFVLDEEASTDESTVEAESLTPLHAAELHDVRSEVMESHALSPDEGEDTLYQDDERDEGEGESELMSFGEDEVELVVTPLFEGVACALPTLFDEDGDVEYKTTARLSKRLTENGVSAVFVATQDGEGGTLSRKERKHLVKDVVKSTEALVVVDVTAPSIRQSVQIADDCADAGARAFIVTLDSSVRDPYALCEALHGAHRESSLFVRLDGDASSLPISPEFLYDLPISGVVDATGDAQYFLHLMTAYSGPVYVGTSHMVLFAGTMGAAGVVLVGVAINSELVSHAFNGDAASQAELAMWERETNGDARSIKLALESELLISSTMRD